MLMNKCRNEWMSEQVIEDQSREENLGEITSIKVRKYMCTWSVSSEIFIYTRMVGEIV